MSDAAALMRAVWHDTTGPARQVLQTGTLPVPQPGPGEVRVRVQWSGINPTDVKRRDGRSGPMAFDRVVPHMDGSGWIDAVGAGVDAGRIGQPVWLHRAAWQRPGGTCAQFTRIRHDRAVPMPAGLDLRIGATLGVPALTAHRAVLGLGPVRGKTVLVTGGAGAVGFYAIQLARWQGATVLATVSDPTKAQEALRAGAHGVIDYRRDDPVAEVMRLTAGAGVDHLVDVDLGANLPVTVEVMKTHGTVAAYGSTRVPTPSLPFYRMQQRSLTVTFIALFSLPEALEQQASADVSAWLATGRLVPPRLHEYALDDTAAAHEAVEQGVLGKVLVHVGA